MALQIWLPLNSNLNNQGIYSLSSITSAGTSTNANGKIGSCMKITGQKDLGYIPDFNTNEISICGWFKFNKNEIASVVSALTYTSAANSPTGNLVGNDSYGGIGIIWYGNNYYTAQELTQLYILGALRTPTVNLNTGAMAIDFDVWTHIAITWNLKTRRVSLYKNGVFNRESTVASNFSDGLTNRQLYINYNAVYGGNGPSTTIPFYANDIRVYDHCLSSNEIKDISKGLVLHYKLNASSEMGAGSTNLVANGWGGTENWQNTTISTDVPPSASFITNSYSLGNTKEYIELISNHSYTHSAYLNRGTSGYERAYLTLIPYDYDKQQIAFRMTTDGFRAASLTTLAQNLKSGDTIVYLTNASGWADPTTYEMYVAIFGYKDSTGYVYPDMVYTRTTLAFGTTTDKSNLDIANNRVTLRSAYKGDTIPAGTSVCLAHDGATYFYPNNVAYTDDSWIQLSGTFTPNTNNYLKACKYVRAFGGLHSGEYAAGITLIDNDSDAVVYDCSGYKHDGTISGQLGSGANSPRYQCSTNFPTGAQSIGIGELKDLAPSGEFTFNVWFRRNTDEWSSKGWETIFGGPSGFELNSKSGTTNSPLIVAYSWGKPTISYTLDQYHMLTMTRNASITKFYLDGVYKASGSTGSIPTGNYFIGSWRDASSQNYRGYMSDCRLYSTVLTDSDIKELYDTSAYIYNNGAIASYEYVEENTQPLVMKNGRIKCNSFSNSSLSIENTSGATWVLLLDHNNPAQNLFTQENCWNNNAPNLFSALGLLKYGNWANSNGEYEFLVRETNTSTQETEAVYRWKQTSNPATSSTLSGYQLISGSPPRSCGLMNKNSYGAFHNGASWWCCCGSYTDYGGGIPGFSDKITSGRLRFYIRIPDVSTIYEDNVIFFKDNIQNNNLIEI